LPPTTVLRVFHNICGEKFKKWWSGIPKEGREAVYNHLELTVSTSVLLQRKE
jgi:hypothetical protein